MKKTAIGQQIVINISSDGISISGFPGDFVQANHILDTAKLIMNNHFLELASKGEIDKHGRKSGGLIVPDKRIVRAC